MTPSIASLDFDNSSKLWQVYVRRVDGTVGYVQLSEDSFTTCGNQLLGQFVLMHWLSAAENT